MKYFLITVIFFSIFTLNAQFKVGGNFNIKDSSSIFEIESTTKGMIFPRLTNNQRNQILKPATGLTIFNVTYQCLQTNTGTPSNPIWVCENGQNLSSGGTSEILNFGVSPCGTNGLVGNMIESMSVSNVFIRLWANVTQLGTWNISAVMNGVTFSGSGVFTTLGCQMLILNGQGIPTNSGTFTWTTNTIPSVSLNGVVSPLSVSSGGTSIVSSWFSIVGCRVGAGVNASPSGITQASIVETMVQGVIPSSSVVVYVRATVTSIGSYNVSTDTVNGVWFTSSGNFNFAGTHQITLVSNGTPLQAGNYVWPLNTTPSINIYGSVLTKSAPLGSSYNNHFNGCDSASSTLHSINQPFANATYYGGIRFSSNTTCQTKPISAQGCEGVSSVISSSGRLHPTININGQCWLQTNLNNIPTVYNNYTSSYWTNTSPQDQGYWGYFDSINTSGNLGWSLNEIRVNEGRMYQWCAAMDATISERSRGICPAGWHIPSDCEWKFLEHGLGMSIAQQNLNNIWRGNSFDKQGTVGLKLRSQGINATNVSGFSGLHNGFRTNGGAFSGRNTYSYFWTSTRYDNTASVSRSLASFSSYKGVQRQDYSNANAISVRCIKD